MIKTWRHKLQLDCYEFMTTYFCLLPAIASACGRLGRAHSRPLVKWDSATSGARAHQESPARLLRWVQHTLSRATRDEKPFRRKYEWLWDDNWSMKMNMKNVVRCRFARRGSEITIPRSRSMSPRPPSVAASAATL